MKPLLFTALALALSACGTSQTAQQPDELLAVYTTDGTCRQSDGAIATPGTNLPSTDRCNSCTCEASGWSCTEIACP